MSMNDLVHQVKRDLIFFFWSPATPFVWFGSLLIFALFPPISLWNFLGNFIWLIVLRHVLCKQ